MEITYRRVYDLTAEQILARKIADLQAPDGRTSLGDTPSLVLKDNFKGTDEQFFVLMEMALKKHEQRYGLMTADRWRSFEKENS